MSMHLGSGSKTTITCKFTCFTNDSPPGFPWSAEVHVELDQGACHSAFVKVESSSRILGHTQDGIPYMFWFSAYFFQQACCQHASSLVDLFKCRVARLS